MRNTITNQLWSEWIGSVLYFENILKIVILVNFYPNFNVSYTINAWKMPSRYLLYIILIGSILGGPLSVLFKSPLKSLQEENLKNTPKMVNLSVREMKIIENIAQKIVNERYCNIPSISNASFALCDVPDRGLIDFAVHLWTSITQAFSIEKCSPRWQIKGFAIYFSFLGSFGVRG